jgi:uncharacterized protein
LARRLLKSGLFIFTCVYLILFIYLYQNQSYMMYPGANWPQQDQAQTEPHLPDHLKNSGAELWKTPNGLYQGLKKESPLATANWVYLHGNGDNALSAYAWNEILRSAYPQKNWNFYVLEYPGYGQRPGLPSQKSLSKAALTALSSLPQPELPLYIAGQSLGSAVAVHATLHSTTPTQGLLLITPLSSMTDAGHVFLQRSIGPLSHLFPLPLLLHDSWNSLGQIHLLKTKTLIIGTHHDPITPAWMSEKLAAAASEPKQLILQDSADHAIRWDQVSNRLISWDFLWSE